jgi:glucose/arabinose dehydrogenase
LIMRAIFLLVAAALLLAPVQAQTPPVPAQTTPAQAQTPPVDPPIPPGRPPRTVYADTGQTCDGWPRASIGMAKGYCAGIVVAPSENFATRTLRMPRTLLPLPGGKDFLVTDIVKWDGPGGKVFRLTAVRGQPATLTPVLNDLYMPHEIVRGPDGKVYVNEIGRLFRFDPTATDPQSTIETVIAGLPDTRIHFNLHPLSSFMFDANKDLLVAVGAPTDQCAKNGIPDGTDFCAESEEGALIRRYAYQGGGKYAPNFTIMAQGLRNSVAMARHSSGTLLQAENNVDFPPADSPFEELNVLRQGAHYGWPYCIEMESTAPLWAQAHVMDCSGPAHTKPVRLLPPHSAPLSMLYYDGAMFPKLRGKLLISLHGYRPAGARIAAFTVDRHGIPLLTPNARYDAYAGPDSDDTVSLPYAGPASEPLVLTPGWNNVNASHPMGAPLGLAVAQDGAIWVVEDRNATILRIARDRP